MNDSINRAELLKARMLKPGDKVTMNDKYYVAEKNKGRVWTVLSDPFMCCGTLVVKLEGKSSVYAADGLDLVKEDAK